MHLYAWRKKQNDPEIFQTWPSLNALLFPHPCRIQSYYLVL